MPLTHGVYLGHMLLVPESVSSQLTMPPLRMPKMSLLPKSRSPADLSALFAEMYERARSDLPDEDPDREFADRGVRLETTFQGAGVMTGDLTPECASIVGKVLDALSAP